MKYQAWEVLTCDDGSIESELYPTEQQAWENVITTYARDLREWLEVPNLVNKPIDEMDEDDKDDITYALMEAGIDVKVTKMIVDMGGFTPV